MKPLFNNKEIIFIAASINRINSWILILEFIDIYKYYIQNILHQQLTQVYVP